LFLEADQRRSGNAHDRIDYQIGSKPLLVATWRQDEPLYAEARFT